MSQDETEPSLAQSAAAWVPPWARPSSPVASSPVVPADAGSESAPSSPVADDEPAVAPVNDDEPTDAETSDDAEGIAVRADDGGGEYAGLSEAELRGALEAILLVVDEPVADMMLAQVLEEPTERVHDTLRALAGEYETTGRGFALRRAAGGWRLYTRPEYASYVERFVLDGQQTRLTQAALETLAVVAYKQPVTRSRISAIRGVNCDGVIKTLVARNLVEECGAEPDSGAFLYRTTTLFLEKLGIDSVEQLPPLAPFLPDNVDEIDSAGR